MHSRFISKSMSYHINTSVIRDEARVRKHYKTMFSFFHVIIYYKFLTIISDAIGFIYLVYIERYITIRSSRYY